ncbi:hypothetical protein A8F94_01925 [Bacillus sp. FJAT-27225]|uniref:hypothetical protein n=1 Tax=Bacillus sp. FJAT-27225 TaxID=1743144 RepID=UPI00080C2745|nr:hypothetical protein [Bacillus sp. FJAT-27225]OCA90659.1 hypothetical protein A8F94_01925 [Bacillus sp. FJAT-27225]
MNRKLTIAVICGVVILAGIIFILDRMKYANYKEAVSDMLSDGEQVKKIEILWTIRDDNQRYIQKTATITDGNIIRKILEVPSEMKLKKHDKTPGIEYWLTVYTDSKIDGIVFGDSDIQIGNSFFKVTDENLLEKVIKNEDLEWIMKN